MAAKQRDVVAVRHVTFEHLGTFDRVLRHRGYAIRYVDAGTDPIEPEMADEAAILFVLGGPIGAYEEDRYPFLLDELALIERRLASGAPMLGICLGAQLIARAMGAPVYPGAVKEIGWAPIELTEAGGVSPLACLESCGRQVLHWHGDTFDLPVGASRLASTAVTPNQAFSAGDAVLGLQFHVEAVPDEIERWLIGHACEIAATDGAEVETIRRDTATCGPPLARCSARLLEDWLGRVGL